MSRNTYFWLCIAFSIIGVFTLGFFSVNRTLQKYQRGSILEGVPINFFRHRIGEFREQTASTTDALREVLKQQYD